MNTEKTPVPSPGLTAAEAAVMDVLNIMDGVPDRLARAPVRRGKPARLDVWREVFADRSADAVPRRLAAAVRLAKGRAN